MYCRHTYLRPPSFQAVGLFAMHISPVGSSDSGHALSVTPRNDKCNSAICIGLFHTNIPNTYMLS